MAVVCRDCGKQSNKRNELLSHMECATQQTNQVNPLSTLLKRILKNQHSGKSYQGNPSVKEDAKEQVVHKCDDCVKEFKMRNHTKYDPVAENQKIIFFQSRIFAKRFEIFLIFSKTKNGLFSTPICRQTRMNIGKKSYTMTTGTEK